VSKDEKMEGEKMKVYEINFGGDSPIIFTEKDIDKFQGVLRRLRMGEKIRVVIEEGYLSKIVREGKK